MKNSSKSLNEKGSLLVNILILVLFITTILMSLMVLSNSNLARARQRIFLLQAQYTAESGADAAIASLNNISDTYSGSGGEITVLTNSLYSAKYSVSVAPGAKSVSSQLLVRFMLLQTQAQLEVLEQ
jgi:type II secretory pathway component PulK